jgi:5-methylthioribose kinase
MMAEILDIERSDALVSYLRNTDRIGSNESPRIRVLAGGVSNRTVHVERTTGESWVVKQALPKLRVEVDWFSDPERIHSEALGMRWLEELAPAGSITPLLFEDREHHLLAMVAVPEPHENWKSMLLEGRLREEHVEQFVQLLGGIHREACYPPERRAEIAEVFQDRSFFESLRLEPYYSYAAEQVPAASGFLRALIEDTLSRQDTLVHGDYSPKNILIHEGRLVLLDHEVVHFGEPAFDLGFSLAHLLSKAHHVCGKREVFADAARLCWRVYRREIGEVGWSEDLQERVVRHTLGCLLARVRGRSPLEYMDEEECIRQERAVLTLLPDLPASVEELVERFVERL